jgi:hypothetical protein
MQDQTLILIISGVPKNVLGFAFHLKTLMARDNVRLRNIGMKRYADACAFQSNVKI